jgi:hypothetical protein
MFFKPMLLPMIAMVALTFAVWVYMYITRISEMSRKRIDPQELDTHVKGLEKLTDSAGPAGNFRNLFEMPILFYVAVLITLVLLIQDAWLIALSWAYVLLRTAHSFIHCTYNNVLHRFTAYVASCVVLFLMWVQLAWYVMLN